MAKKTLSNDDFNRILNGLDHTYENMDGWIEISDARFEEFVILLEETVTFTNKIALTNCEFTNHFSLRGGIFKNHVHVTGCSFQMGLAFDDVTFEKDLQLIKVNIQGTLGFMGGKYQDVEISIDQGNKFWISGGNFKSLKLDMYDDDKLLEELTVINGGDLAVNLSVRHMTINSISLTHDNGQRNYEFVNVRCNVLKMHEFINTGNLSFYGLSPISEYAIIQVNRSFLSKTQFSRINFKGFAEVIFTDSYIGEVNIINSLWSDTNFRARTHPEGGKQAVAEITETERSQLKEVFRQLKFVYEKQGDGINASFFHALEMNTYNSLLKWSWPTHEPFWQKLILYLSSHLTDYGSSFMRPLVGILLANFVSLLVLIRCFGYESLEINFSAEFDQIEFNRGVGEYFKLINPLHKMNEGLSGLGVFTDLISRILSSYFIYGLIRSSRRFLR